MRAAEFSDRRVCGPVAQGAQRLPLAPFLRLLLLAVLLGAFALRLQELTRQNIWWDEARNIDVALRPMWQIPSAPELDIQPPVYYWLLHAWNGLLGVTLGQPPDVLALASRLLSVLAGVLGVALLFPLARRGLPPGEGAAVAGVLAALAGAASPFWLAESQEARMYTVGFALLACAALALLRHIENQNGGTRVQGPGRADLPALAAFVLPATAALLTHYNAVFVLVTWFGWWGIWALRRPDRWRQLGGAVGAGLAMALLALPILPIALRQLPDYENPNITIPSIGDYLGQNWQAYAGGYAFDPGLLRGNGAAWLWLLLALAAVGVGVAFRRDSRPHARRTSDVSGEASLRRARGQEDDWRTGDVPGEARLRRARGQGDDWRTSDLSGEASLRRARGQASTHRTGLSFLLAWLLGALALYYVAVLDRNAFNVRYASFVTPALYALLGVGLAAYGRWGRLLPALGAALLLLGLLPAVQADLYDARFDREHTAEAAAWLQANTGPGDVIFVDQKYPFGFYYQPYAIPGSDSQGVADARGAGEDEQKPARYLFVDINTLDQRLNEWAGDARRVFWLQWYESDTDPRKAVRFLLDKYGRHAGEQTFQGYTLEWWELDPPTHFELAPHLQPLSLAFWGSVQTAAASLPAEPLHPGDALPVVIRWGLNAQGSDPAVINQPLKARVALYDESGARLVQADERLLNDRHRAPGQWGPDDQPLNVYLLPLPADLPPGQYTLGLLVYDADTLAAVDEEATLGTIEVR